MTPLGPNDLTKHTATRQAGIVSWVTFWALYGQGFTVENIASIATFGVAYMSVIPLEPLADLLVLAGAKAVGSLRALPDSGLPPLFP